VEAKSTLSIARTRAPAADTSLLESPSLLDIQARYL
jgi:hypothetical protein